MRDRKMNKEKSRSMLIEQWNLVDKNLSFRNIWLTNQNV
jgi:hypothetical protein